jgi:virginiamycin B lyase
MRRSKAAISAIMLAAAQAVDSAHAQTITEFPLPGTAGNGQGPLGITAGPDGALWFTSQASNSTPPSANALSYIGRITTNGALTQFPLPIASGFLTPNFITLGPDGALWFTDSQENLVARITTAGAISSFMVPTKNSDPTSITAGPDNALWFVETAKGKIGRISTGGVFSEFPTLASPTLLNSITLGSDNALWFSDNQQDHIGHITPAGSISNLALPPPNEFPQAIAAGPDGALYYLNEAQFSINPIERITTSGNVTRFINSPEIGPSSLTKGPDGAVWFTDPLTNSIGRMTVTGLVTEFPIPTANSQPTQITTGPDGALWFTELLANQVGRIAPPSASNTPLVAAVLPASRSVEVGGTASAFVTVINSGIADLSGCALAPLVDLNAAFSYQATDPANNAPIGAPNTPITIAAGAVQTFVITLAAIDTDQSTAVGLNIQCAGVAPAPSQVGVNTLLYSASSTPVADVVALVATASNDGILHIGGSQGTGAFAVATVNVGATASITASANTGTALLPLNLSICQTNPATAACISPIGPTVTAQISAGATPTFAVFAGASGQIAFAPATSRIFVTFTDSSGAVHGESSVAVQTQ